MHSVRPTITLDFRDDFARPSKGLLISGSAELTNDFGAELTTSSGEHLRQLAIHTLKLSGTITGYVPLAPRTVLALSARGGKIVHLAEDSETISPKRFFLGGSTSMRGFSEEGMIAEDRRVELRETCVACRMLAHDYGCTPDARPCGRGASFPPKAASSTRCSSRSCASRPTARSTSGCSSRQGTCGSTRASSSCCKLRYVAGAGVRYGTPIGPLALDVGFNLFPDSDLNEPTANVHFSIGLF